jgi:hypothetical protein
MRRVYAEREMPAEWRQPRGVVTELVDRSTGLTVDDGCPPRGETYTEYFVRTRPPRQLCPDGRFPVLTADGYPDDDLWDGFDGTPPGGMDLDRSGIQWPELEEMRRRGETGGGREPLPGEVVPRDMRRVDTAAARPAAPPAGEPARPPAGRTPREPPRVIGEPVEPPSPAAPDEGAAAPEGDD